MSDQPIVHVVDDDPGLRKSLGMIMQSANLSAAFYESAEEFLAEHDRNRPGCLVLDLRMPGMGGLDLINKLRAADDEIPVIIISGHADVPTAVRGMKSGAMDLLQKPFEPQALLVTIRRALARSVEHYRQRAERIEIQRRFSDLTAREHDLLMLIVAGLSNKQIAVEMGIAVKTVANHRAHLMEKTQALNAADLARMTVIAGIAAPTET